MTTQQEKAETFAKAIWAACVEYIETAPSDLSRLELNLVTMAGERLVPAFDELHPVARNNFTETLDGPLGDAIHEVAGACAMLHAKLRTPVARHTGTQEAFQRSVDHR